MFLGIGMNQDRAKLIIAASVQSFASKILEVFKELPKGISPDSVSVKPSSLSFTGEIDIQNYEMDED
ncbi:hypothetical protein [Nostoc sp.]|uniref:hypothetical protein n=1 Tax=Nostoc sp. TaxID=1180 RepID=UPI002FF656CF